MAQDEPSFLDELEDTDELLEEDSQQGEEPLSSESLREQIESAYENVDEEEPKSKDRARDEKGRFAKSDSLQEEAKADLPPIEPPKSWASEKKAIFSQLPREAQEYVLQRETERDTFLTQKSEEASKAINESRSLKEAIEPFREQLELQGFSVPNAVRQLLTWHNFMEKNPAEALRRLAGTYNLTLEGILQQQPARQVDPQIEELNRKLSAFEEYFANQQNSQISQQHLALQQQVEAFRDEAGADGKPIRPFFAQAQNEMLTLIPAIRQANPNLSPQQVLAAAYDQAVYANPETRKLVLEMEEQKRVMANNEKLQAAKKAAVSIVGSGMADAAKKQPDNLRNQLESLWEDLH